MPDRESHGKKAPEAQRRAEERRLGRPGPVRAEHFGRISKGGQRRLRLTAEDSEAEERARRYGLRDRKLRRVQEERLKRLRVLVRIAPDGLAAGASIPPMMRCGHAANATLSNLRPFCAVCELSAAPLSIDDAQPDLFGCTARCYFCDREQPSSVRLAYFEHRPAKGFDGWYCGCQAADLGDEEA